MRSDPAPPDTLPLGRLAFYWRMTSSEAPPNPVPDFLPFSFGYDSVNRLITQQPDPQVLETLRTTYRLESNIGYMQEGHALADRYGLDFLAFFEKAVAGRAARRVMDVGCGGCYALNALKGKGYEVFGLDPGPLTVRWGEKLGIPIATGFYPFEHGFGKMDVVFSSGVLEHVPDPVGFLFAQQRDLAPGGCIVVSTPDNEPSIRLGDPSMLLHEHLSYFDRESLARVLESAGYDVAEVALAGYGQTVYALATPRAGSAAAQALPDDGKWARFSRLTARSLERFKAYVRPLLDDSRAELGFYVPLRALPYLSVLGAFTGFRFFDDDPGTHGRLFDGFVSVPVEGWDSFVARPPTHVVIMSLPHADAIGRKIQAAMRGRVSAVTLQQILEGAVAKNP